ncbi:hypothetical protein GGTG_13056 [Gaeumannomyces tritici R3-111a-1]|uniref:Uncharacterized protein n=1 Tax=Gaeumannomyces tritici (strain R3-111a-1) TaxID=644352 RepID=J3PHS5_GAET3|nr:hypothetical protein GGTG_13056 [Gaeumannomyces tritici R3-111a-1]EJT69437.1 hypothetical protein GGTG_13056 [Gaeumannomyces tritici R3-111a-1]
MSGSMRLPIGAQAGARRRDKGSHAVDKIGAAARVDCGELGVGSRLGLEVALALVASMYWLPLLSLKAVPLPPIWLQLWAEASCAPAQSMLARHSCPPGSHDLVWALPI